MGMGILQRQEVTAVLRKQSQELLSWAQPHGSGLVQLDAPVDRILAALQELEA